MKISERVAGGRTPALDGPGRRVAVIAGGGQLPIDVARRLLGDERDHVVVLVDGEARAADFAGHATDRIALEEIGSLVALLRRLGATHVVMAGTINRRPELRRIKLCLGLLPVLRQLLASRFAGDNAVLAAIVRHLERQGFAVLGAHEVEPDLLAPRGVITRRKPDAADRRDLAAAREAALAIGALDIGQAAVAIGGRAVALEGIEGTDGLLERTAPLRSHGRLARARGGVLVKCVKPGQERRADLPTIGPGTVEAAHAAGLAGVGVSAGASLILDFGTVVARADALGMFVVGLAEDGTW